MENTLVIYLVNLAVIMIFMVGVWLLSLLKKDASIVDGFWGLGFILVAWITFGLSHGSDARKLLLAILTTAWGLRLSLHIFWRNRGKAEDRRYRAWRSQYGERFWFVSLFTVFGLQGLILWGNSLVLQAGQFAPTPEHLTWLDLLGAGIWLFGFLFESIGDWQLLRFKRQPENQGHVMNQGLWAYTRHPNYFGEAVLWWGIFCITLATPGNVWTIISPLLITWLLINVSGVALLERTLLDIRPEYRTYCEHTNAFFPWKKRSISKKSGQEEPRA